MILIPLLATALVQVPPHSSPEPREENRALPRKPRGPPGGLLVPHHPNPCYPVRDAALYVWRHNTTVQSLAGDLTLVEYGAYINTGTDGCCERRWPETGSPRATIVRSASSQRPRLHRSRQRTAKRETPPRRRALVLYRQGR